VTGKALLEGSHKVMACAILSSCKPKAWLALLYWSLWEPKTVAADGR
jgi:hypothetical protein